MNTVSMRFMEAMRAALQGQQLYWPMGTLCADEWTELFMLAQRHHVLPLILEAVYTAPAAQEVPDFPVIRAQAIQTVLLQTIKTDAFMKLYQKLRQQQLRPLVVKGILCRELYPLPDHRLSSDEDLLISESQFSDCMAVMHDLDMHPGTVGICGVSFVRPDSSIYIEMHRYLFSPESEAYGHWNQLFSQIHQRAVPITIHGVELLVPDPTDHLLYLICHAFKHFMHGGFGIRQVCDICLFANHYGSQIDWQLLFDRCSQIQAQLFAAAIFQIGSKHLVFDPVKACYPACWQQLQVDEGPLLEDLLDSGIYGNASLSRIHSSSITLNAVAAHRHGKKAAGKTLRVLLPSAASLSGRYPYLKKSPWLLPVAWCSRIVNYRKETKHNTGNAVAASIAMGNQRLDLFRQYGILTAIGQIPHTEASAARRIFIITNHSYMLWQFRRELILELKKNHEVVLCMPFVGHEQDFEALGLRCIEIPMERRSISLRSDLKLMSTYRKLLKREKPDLVITYSIKPNIYVGLLCSHMKIPFYANVQGLGTAFQSKSLASVVTLLYKTAFRKVQKVFFENEGNAAEFCDRRIVSREKIKVLSGAGINTEHYALQEYPKNDVFRFLFVGRIMKEKGLDELLYAVKRLASEGERFNLDLVGFYEDEYSAQVEQLQQAGIAVFHGFQQDTRPYYAAADCVLQPSYHEGMSNVILEAAATGRPVIVSNISGCREAVEDSVTGILVPAKDADALYEAMKQMLHTPCPLRAHMGIKGREKVYTEFNKVTVVQQTIETLGLIQEVHK